MAGTIALTQLLQVVTPPCNESPVQCGPPKSVRRTGCMKMMRYLFALLVLSVLSNSGAALAQNSFSVVLLPDTQNYAEKASYGVYAHQAQWIVNNRSSRNIQFVVHLGDVTNHDVAAEWQTADAAHAILDAAGVPYGITTGNHDLFPTSDVHSRDTLLGQYFPPSRFSSKSWYGGS